jgi:hypothetical protein
LGHGGQSDGLRSEAFHEARASDAAAATATNTQAMKPHIQVFVSDWFTDELGNKARIIKARD